MLKQRIQFFQHLQFPQGNKMDLLFILIAVTCAFPLQNTSVTDSIRLDDLLTGEVVVEGKSGLPIGTVTSGFVKTIIDDKNSTTIMVETEERRFFSYRNDQKYDHFAYVLGKKTAQIVSLRSIQHQDIEFFEQFTSGGDPREFISFDDFRSGPPFRIRMHLAVIASSDSLPSRAFKEYPKKIAWEDLESGRKRIIGKLDEPLGTVVECRCLLTSDAGKYAVVSTNKVKDLRFDANRIVFKKAGCVVDWKYLEKAKIRDFDSICYERVDCLGVPERVRDKIGLDSSTSEFGPIDFLVVKLPSEIELPGFDFELIQAGK